ncbi:MAG: YIP1 family protein [Deltaproteobacteria bacterium]|nr:YIP1 family protein [Deltaproteobacteria bacterium]
MKSLFDRMIRAAKLDISLYEEVEADKAALGQSMAVVLISSIAAGIGTITVSGFSGIIWGTVTALLGWLIWSYLIYVIGTKLFPAPETKADHGELLRAIGFSSSPGVIRVLGIIPGLGAIVMILASIWMLVTMVIAVRQALDYTSTLRAVGVCVIGWIIQGIVFGIVYAFMK